MAEIATASPSPPDPTESDWSRVASYSDRLYDALERLDDAGGLPRIASRLKWSTPTLDKALTLLVTTRDALNAEIVRIEARRRHYPRPRRLG